jgi:hypothetical protein
MSQQIAEDETGDDGRVAEVVEVAKRGERQGGEGPHCAVKGGPVNRR